MARSLAIILGIGNGGGTGASSAKVFARAGYDVAVIGRRAGAADALVKSVKADGGTIKAYEVKDYGELAMKDLFKGIRSDWSDSTFRVAIFNAGRFKMGGFLEQSEQDVRGVFDDSVISGWNFAHEAIQGFLEAPEPEGTAARGTLIFTGASAALRGSKNFSSFAIAKFGIRALSQSLAREFHPQNIHVAHSIIDGGILTDRSASYMDKSKIEDPSQLLSPDAIANSYLYLARQEKSAFTQELDLRPCAEKF